VTQPGPAAERDPLRPRVGLGLGGPEIGVPRPQFADVFARARALGLASPTVRELIEMQYQFEEPFVVDSSRIAGKLGVEATPLEQALADTLRSYRDG